MCPCSLDLNEHFLLPLWSFQGAREPIAHEKNRHYEGGLSKLNSVTWPDRRLHEGGQTTEPGSRSTLFQASRVVRTASKGHQTDPTPTGVRAPVFPRKEVIQPQLPLRLPCYDFTPIINPTFDGCLPEGLAHRLRVLPTFVV